MVKKGQNKAIILNIALDSTSKERVLREIRVRLAEFGRSDNKSRPFLVATPNPEIILQAWTDPKLAAILNRADFSLPDGVGLSLAFRFNGLYCPKNKICRPAVFLWEGLCVGLALFFNPKWLSSGLKVIKGREFFWDLMKLANKKSWRVVLVGNRTGSAQAAAAVLEASFQSVKIKALEGPNLNQDGKPLTDEDKKIEDNVVQEINRFKPHLVFVGFGAGKQEKWADRWLLQFNCGGIMTVGRTFEWVSGKSRTAPDWLAQAGLEWLWRLLTGSTDLKRIFNAVFIFPWQVFKFKLKS